VSVPTAVEPCEHWGAGGLKIGKALHLVVAAGRRIRQKLLLGGVILLDAVQIQTGTVRVDDDWESAWSSSVNLPCRANLAGAAAIELAADEEIAARMPLAFVEDAATFEGEYIFIAKRAALRRAPCSGDTA
jgi:hypothetical protein